MARRRRQVRWQRPLKGGRPQVSAKVEREVRKRVEREAAAHGVSMSFVANVRLAVSYGIEVEHYDGGGDE